MASKQGIKAGRAYVELGVNDAFTRGLNKAKAQLASFGAGITKIGVGLTAVSGAVIAPLAAAVLKFSNSGDAVAKMAKRIGIGGAALQELGHAADLSGADMDTLEKGFKKMAKTIVDANDGMKESQKAFQSVGLDAANLAKLTPEAQFEAIAAALGSIEDPTLKAARAQEIFGRAGTQLIPLLNEGAAGIAAMRKEARDLGIVLDDEALAVAEELNDQLGRMKSAFGGVSNQIGAALAPAVSAAIGKILPVIAATSKWIKENKEVVVTVAKIALTIGAAGAAFLALGGTLTVISIAMGGFISAWGAIVAIVVAAKAAFLALLTPVGALTAAVVTAAAAIVYFSGAGGAAINWLKEQFRSLTAFTGEVVGGVADALKAGDIKLAVEVLWAGVKLAWQAGIFQLEKLWSVALKNILGFFVDFKFALITLWNEAMGAIEAPIHETVGFVARQIINLQAAIGGWSEQMKKDALAAEATNRRADIEGGARARAATADEIAKAHVDAAKTIEDASDASVTAAREELAKAEAEFGKARDKAKKAAAGATGGGPRSPDLDIPDFEGARAATQSKLESKGGFSLSALSSAFGGNEQKQTAANTARIATATDRMVRLLLNGGTFA